MLYEHISSDKEENDGDKLTGDHIVKLHHLTTNIEFLCAKNVQIIRI